MLAQNFKSHVDLGIGEVEQTSLVKVLGMLERGELQHGMYPLARMFRQSNESNMATLLNEANCGTIGCIAGWAHHISGGEAFPEIAAGNWEVRWNRSLIDLFGIGRSIGSLYHLTPAQAATALRSYLTTGDAKWSEAVA